MTVHAVLPVGQLAVPPAFGAVEPGVGIALGFEPVAPVVRA